MTRRCARQGCNNPVNSRNAAYCSRTCANRSNAEKRVRQKEIVEEITSQKQEGDSNVRVVRSELTPKLLEDKLVSVLGHAGANAVLSEVEGTLQDAVQMGEFPDWLRRRYPVGTSAYSPLISIPRPSVDPPGRSTIEPHSFLRGAIGTDYMSEIRDDSQVSFKDIDRLLKLGPCVLASRIKKGPIMSALSGKRKWALMCSDNKLKKVIEADLERVFLRNVHDILSALDYGVAFGAVRWGLHTAESIGVEAGVGKSSQWYIVDKIEWAHPATVSRIVRNTRDGAFAGFQHHRQHRTPRDVVVDPMQALVVTYNNGRGLFGNMWGESAFEGVYDFAFWYEIVMRAFLRYLQRMATPVTVVYGPQRGTSKRPDGTRISNPQYGLLLAGAAAMSSAIYMPSEVDIQSSQPLWRMEYLETNQKGEHFIQALQYLGTGISRGMLVGDRAFTQDGTTGSYGAGEIHNKLTQIDNDFIFKLILGQLNDYLVVRYGMWNVDYNNPPLARLRAEVVDPDEQEILMKLFATAGNVKLGDGTPLDRVDWEEAFRSIHVPQLNDTELQAMLDEMQQRKLDNMEETQKVQAKNQGSFGGNGGSQNGNNRGRQPAPQPRRGEADVPQQARMAVIDYLAEGNALPVTLNFEQVRELVGQGQEVIQGEIQLARTTTKRGKPVKNPEFEQEHNRAADGTFASKEEKTDDEDEETKDDRDRLGQEPWPGANPEKGIKGVVNLDGVTYTVVGDLSSEELIALHETNQRMYESSAEFGRTLEQKPVTVMRIDDYEAIARNAGSDPAQVKSFVEEYGGMWAMADKNKGVVIDSGLISKPEYLETELFHETLHLQPRKSNGDLLFGDTEETFTTLATMAYAESRGIPGPVGYPKQVGLMAAAAEELGWSKEKLYRYADLAQQTDGSPGQYENMRDFFFERAGISKSDNRVDALDRLSPNWRDFWRGLEEVYHWDFDIIDMMLE